MAQGHTITRRDLDNAITMTKRARDAAARMSEATEKVAGQVAQTLEIGAGALGMGTLTGRFGPIKLGPIPIDLLGGLALHLGGFFGLYGKYAEHGHNLADGVLANYLSTLGAGLGTTLRLKAGLSAFTAGENARLHGGMPTSHAGALGGGSPLTEAEMAAMAQAAA